MNIETKNTLLAFSLVVASWVLVVLLIFGISKLVHADEIDQAYSELKAEGFDVEIVEQELDYVELKAELERLNEALDELNEMLTTDRSGE